MPELARGGVEDADLIVVGDTGEELAVAGVRRRADLRPMPQPGRPDACRRLLFGECRRRQPREHQDANWRFHR